MIVILNVSQHQSHWNISQLVKMFAISDHRIGDRETYSQCFLCFMADVFILWSHQHSKFLYNLFVRSNRKTFCTDDRLKNVVSTQELQ